MIEKKLWGSLPDGREISLYRLTNKWGEYAEFLDYGASLHSLYLLDGAGKLGDVVLGVEGPQGLQGSTTEGATVGRCASRIADGRFVIDGKVFELEKGSGGHCLHSGSSNFARQLFQARLEEEENKIAFASYLASHPLTWVDGKQYGVTQEDQSEIALNINQYQVALAAGVENPTLEWHAKQEECYPWSLEQLSALSLAISNVVYPKYHQMQEYKTAIFAATSIAELNAIELTYEDTTDIEEDS